MAPVFIVSTGRCGSALLSRLLGTHPDAVSVSGLFNRPGSGGALAEPQTGSQFWNSLASPVELFDAIVRDGLAPEEFQYPYGRGRFGLRSGTPVISHTTLPCLTDDPDGLFDELAAEIPSRPRHPTARHYRDLLGWFRRRFGGRVVVERTAGSLAFVAELVSAFPDARFVYLHRSGADTVLSMNRHVINRFDAIALDALRIIGATSFRSLPPESLRRAGGIRRHLPILMPPYDLRALTDFDIPLDAFIAPWLRATRDGIAVLERLPAGQRAVMSYEDLVNDPERTLGALAAFLRLPAPEDWLDAAARQVHVPARRPAPTWRDHRLAALRAACALRLPEPTLR